jgi:threonine aldolase
MPIDMRSDTVTRPTAAMRQAMATAEVGDDVLDGDPTVRRLERLMAELLGKDQALFFPSGTMANQAALWLLGKRGTEVLLDANAHITHWEVAAAAGLCGLQVRPVASDGPVMRAADLSRAVRPTSPHAPTASLVCVENTHNGAGGKLTAADDLGEIAAVARRIGLPVHMDGARLWNASAATGTPLDRFAAHATTVMMSFSKGLGAPVGAVLAGPADVMADAWATRKRFGGGMRQSGILAAAALHAIEHHRSRLGEDHDNARRFAAIVDGAGGATVVHPDTNIVMVDLPASVDTATVTRRAADAGVLISPWSTTRVRAVTHLDVDRAAVEQAAGVVARAMEAA